MSQVRDVAIVGAGLLGLASGRALTAQGRDVVVLEQAEIGHQGAGSKGSCRIFRLGYADPAYVAAARSAGELWRQLEAESGYVIMHPTAQLTFGTGLRAVMEAMTQAGAPCELLPASEVAHRFPAIRTGGPALLEPESCVTAADQALAALRGRRHADPHWRPRHQCGRRRAPGDPAHQHRTGHCTSRDHHGRAMVGQAAGDARHRRAVPANPGAGRLPAAGPA